MTASLFYNRHHAGRGDVQVLAVPAASTCAALRAEADELVCAATPEPFVAVGRWYEDFSQTGDDEVRALLAQPMEKQA